jgi:hypothetical protein
MAIEGRQPRSLVTWPLQYRRLGTSAWLPARTVNISTTGVLFRAMPPPALAENLELRILTETPTDSPMRPIIVVVSGRVVRHEPALEGAVGVEFHAHIELFNASPKTVDRSADTLKRRGLASEEPHALRDQLRQGLVECGMCHQPVSQAQTRRLGGRTLCFSCLAGWYEDDEPLDA